MQRVLFGGRWLLAIGGWLVCVDSGWRLLFIFVHSKRIGQRRVLVIVLRREGHGPSAHGRGGACSPGPPSYAFNPRNPSQSAIPNPRFTVRVRITFHQAEPTFIMYATLNPRNPFKSAFQNLRSICRERCSKHQAQPTQSIIREIRLIPLIRVPNYSSANTVIHPVIRKVADRNFSRDICGDTFG